MHSFLQNHTDKITGTLSSFDRLIFRGYLPCCHPKGLEGLLNYHDVLLKDFKTFAPQQAERLKAHAQQFAAQRGRPFRHLAHKTRKDELARQIAQQDGVTEGLIAVFSTLETCRTFRVAYGQGRPRLKADYRRCLVLYYYLLDPEFGLIHLKLQTWFAFTLQVYVNGHEWLARQMTRQGLGFVQLDNAFVRLDDAPAAQRLANRFGRLRWPRLLQAWARQINPLFADLLKGAEYYWVTDQAEYATDVMFRDRAALASLYPRLLQHATLCLSAEDVLGFLGRKLTAAFAGEILNESKKRWPGARVKHRVAENWIKMYDKQGLVLRIETVINRPYAFKVYRRAKRRGQEVLGWFPLCKGVSYLWRYAEVSQRANQRYLDALSVVDDPSARGPHLEEVCEPVRVQGQRHRALNPLSRRDQALFVAALRGEHALQGFRNRDLAAQLYKGTKPRDRAEARRRCARVSRLIRLLRGHRLVAKVPRARRYQVTARGQALLSAAVRLRENQ